MFSAAARRRALAVDLLRPRPQPLSCAPRQRLLVPVVRRAYVAAPKPGDGPLMERRADRELPDVAKWRFRWSHTLPIFLLIVAGSSVAIFNYQKSSSPVVASTLYALRTSPRARAYLGDEVYFQQRIPWISGEMNQLRGRIDITFLVKGTKNTARMRFTSHRHTARGVFETDEWSLETADGRKIDLLEDVANDPFRGIQILPDEYVDEFEQDYGLVPPPPGTAAMPKETRGFRQATNR